MIAHYHSLPNKGDVLPQVWQRLREDDPPSWLWGNYAPLTLAEFIVFFSDPGRHLFISCTEDGQDVTGMLWVDEIAYGQHARAHFYFIRKYRGKKSTQIRKTCEAILDILRQPPFNLQTLLLFTDVRAYDAQRVAMRFGGVYLGDVPGYYPGEYSVRFGYISLKGQDHGIIRRPIGRIFSSGPDTETAERTA